jgi:WD40 repeat protein
VCDGSVTERAGLSAGKSDGTVRLWNPATGQPVGAPLQAAFGAPVPAASDIRYALGAGGLAVAFSPDGKLLGAANAYGTARLWNPVTGQPVGVPLRTSSEYGTGVAGVAFSPDGKLLATASAGNRVRTWQISLFVNPYATICADVGPPTRADWTGYAPGEPQPEVCG